MERNDEYKYLSVSEFAKMKNVSTTTVYTLIQEGKLETIPYRRGAYNGYVIKLCIDNLPLFCR